MSDPTRGTLIDAQGMNAKVLLRDDKLVVENKGVGSFFKQMSSLYKEGPGALTEALDGPNKNVLLEALAESRGLMKGLVQSLQDSNAVETDVSEKMNDRKLVEVVKTALVRNKSAVVSAIHQNDVLVKSWLVANRELSGIFLRGDVHLFTDDLDELTIQSVRTRRFLVVRRADDGTEIRVEYEPSHEAEFRLIVEKLSSPREETDQPGAAIRTTRACPECAEDVKLAAKVCRFCSYRFEPG